MLEVMLQKSTIPTLVVICKMKNSIVKPTSSANQSGLYLAPNKREQPEQATYFISIYSLYLHLVLI
jgi:hypothetical protein